MSKYRIYELAKEFNTTSKVVLDILERNNNTVAKNHMSSVGDTEKDIITKTFAGKTSTETKVAAKATTPTPAPTTVVTKAATAAPNNNFKPKTPVQPVRKNDGPRPFIAQKQNNNF